MEKEEEKERKMAHEEADTIKDETDILKLTENRKAN